MADSRRFGIAWILEYIAKIKNKSLNNVHLTTLQVEQCSKPKSFAIFLGEKNRKWHPILGYL